MWFSFTNGSWADKQFSQHWINKSKSSSLLRDKDGLWKARFYAWYPTLSRDGASLCRFPSFPNPPNHPSNQLLPLTACLCPILSPFLSACVPASSRQCPVTSGYLLWMIYFIPSSKITVLCGLWAKVVRTNDFPRTTQPGGSMAGTLSPKFILLVSSNI